MKAKKDFTGLDGKVVVTVCEVDKESLGVLFLTPNTELCVELKTLLLGDRRAEMGKAYRGVLTHDSDEHFTFVETRPRKHKYSPQVFNGKFITVARGSDGTLRPHLKRMRIDSGTDVGQYAAGVGCELILALNCLVEKERKRKRNEAMFDTETIGW